MDDIDPKYRSLYYEKDPELGYHLGEGVYMDSDENMYSVENVYSDEEPDSMSGSEEENSVSFESDESWANDEDKWQDLFLDEDEENVKIISSLEEIEKWGLSIFLSCIQYTTSNSPVRIMKSSFAIFYEDNIVCYKFFDFTSPNTVFDAEIKCSLEAFNWILATKLCSDIEEASVYSDSSIVLKQIEAYKSHPPPEVCCRKWRKSCLQDARIRRIPRYSSSVKAKKSDYFWDLIQKLDWGSDGDYERINEELRQLGAEEARKLDAFVDVKINELTRRWGGCVQSIGDDGWSDLRAEVVGRGKEFYKKIMKNTEGLKKLNDIAQNGDYEESFRYGFHCLLDSNFNKESETDEIDDY